MKKHRQGNVELLRVVLMLMIVMHHLIVHGLNLKSINVSTPAEVNSSLRYEFFMNSFLVVAVNVFVLISGYFKIKFNSSRIFNLFAQGLLFSLVIKVFLAIFFPNIEAHVNNWGYWFLVGYFALSIISQFINRFFETLNNKELISTAFILFFLFCVFDFRYNKLGIGNGNSFAQLIVMYCFGCVLYRFKYLIFKIKKRWFALSYVFFCLTNFILVFGAAHTGHSSFAWKLYAYNNPLVVFGAVSFFCFFIMLTVNWNVRAISANVFGVYLLHDNQYIRSSFIEQYMKSFLGEGNHLVYNIPLVGIAIFLLCIPLSMIITSAIAFIINSKVFNKLFKEIDGLLEINNDYKSSEQQFIVSR